LLSVVTGKPGNFIFIPEGSDYSIDNSDARELIGNEHFAIDPDEYVTTLLIKYYGTDVKNFPESL
jgi:hypothetical protein